MGETIYFMDLLETLGFPIAIVFIGALFFWNAQKQASARDRDNSRLHELNANLHKEHLTIQGNQTKILERLADKANKNQDELIANFGKIEALINGNHGVLVEKFSGVLGRLTDLQNTLTDAKDSHERRLGNIETGINSITSEIKSVIESTIKSEKDDKNEQNTTIPNVSSMLAGND